MRGVRARVAAAAHDGEDGLRLVALGDAASVVDVVPVAGVYAQRTYVGRECVVRMARAR